MRSAPQPQPLLDWVNPDPKGVTLKYKVELITPMFGGGVKARAVDEGMPIRAREVRGQLRFWWRFLARKEMFDDVPKDKVHETEWRLWGGLSGEDDDKTAQHGLLDVRIQPPSTAVVTQPYNEKEWPGTRYALFSAYDERAKLLPQGFSFSLRLLVRDRAYQEQVKEAVHWWAAFGGVGSRTRRGAGALSVQLGDNLLPVPCHDKLKRADCTLLAGKDNTNALVAWKDVISAMRDLRQGLDGRNGNQGRSFWPEPAAIRKITEEHRVKYVDKPPENKCSFEPPPAQPEHFPRAAFGLPIIFQFKNIKDDLPENNIFKDYRSDPERVVLTPLTRGKFPNRLASPVILKPLALANGKFVPAALFIPDEHVRTMGVRLANVSVKNANKKLLNPKDIAASLWYSTAQEDYPSSKSPKPVQATFPLDAFQQYLKDNKKWTER